MGADTEAIARKTASVVEATSRAQAQALDRTLGKMRDMNHAAARAIGTAVAAVGAGLAAATIASLKFAMGAVESENLFEVSMGKMADSARAWSESLRRSLGLNAYDVRKTVGTYNVMLTSMGLAEQSAYDMAKGLTQLSYDMASFYNLPIDVAFEKLQSGISGEIEPLKQLGIVVNKATTEAYAYAHGIAKQGEALSETQKIEARYGVIMAATAKAQGDLARTMDSPTNKLRIMGERVKNVAIDLGTKLIPAFDGVLRAIEPVMQKVEAMAADGTFEKWGDKAEDAVRSLIEKIEALAAWLRDNGDDVVKWGKRLAEAWVFSVVVTEIAGLVRALGTIKIALLGIGNTAAFKALWAGGIGGAAVAGLALADNMAGTINKSNPGSTVDKYGNPKKSDWQKLQESSKASTMFAPATGGGFVGPPTKAQAAALAAALAAQAAAFKPALDKVRGTTGDKEAQPATEAAVKAANDYKKIMADFAADADYRATMEAQLGDYYDQGAAKISDYQSAIQALNKLAIPEAVRKATELGGAFKRMMGEKNSADWVAAQAKEREAALESSMKSVQSQLRSDAAGQVAIVADREQKIGDLLAKRVLDQYERAQRKLEDQTAKDNEWTMNKIQSQGAFDKGRRGSLGSFRVGDPDNAPAPSFFSKLMSSLQPVLEPFKQLGSILQSLNPAVALVDSLMSTLAPMIQTLLAPIALVGAALGQALAPILEALFPVFKFLGQVVIGVAQVIARVWNGLISLVSWIPGLGFLNDYKMDLDALAKAQSALSDITYDNAQATLDQYTATQALTEATEAAADTMRNVPNLFKAALRRGQSADSGLPGHGGGVTVGTGPTAPPTPPTMVRPQRPSGSSLDGYQPYHPTPGSRGLAVGSAAPVTINIDARGATDPGATKKAVKEAVLEAQRDARVRSYGLGLAGGRA